MYNPETDEGYEVNNPDVNELNVRYEKGDFSTTVYVFDDNKPLYLGEKVDPSRKSIAGKTLFYPLAGYLGKPLEGYPLVAEVMAKKDDPVFRARIRAALVEVCSTLRARIMELCKNKNLYVQTIALTIPAEWSLEFEDVYRDIISEAFEHPAEDIIFLTETEAFVHYLFKHHTRDLGCLDKDVDKFLMLDFGGHSMV